MHASEIATRSLRAIGTTAVVAVTDPAQAERALAVVGDELDALDLACSRFRPDSEIHRLYREPGTAVPVSELLFDVLRTALEVAADTEGAVDPTVGSAMEALGYDRDFAALSEVGPELDAHPAPAPGWRLVELDPGARTARVPAGVSIDVGSSAKAFAADRTAVAVAGETGAGALVSVGGDVAVAGPAPSGGWAIGIAPDSSAPLDAVDQVVAITEGGLASSSPFVRSWRRGGRRLTHILDPATGSPASPHWQLVSVTAPTCVMANALATAAVVWGEAAVPRLRKRGHPARLVDLRGQVVVVNGWPEAADLPTA